MCGGFIYLSGYNGRLWSVKILQNEQKHKKNGRRKDYEIMLMSFICKQKKKYVCLSSCLCSLYGPLVTFVLLKLPQWTARLIVTCICFIFPSLSPRSWDPTVVQLTTNTQLKHTTEQIEFKKPTNAPTGEQKKKKN